MLKPTFECDMKTAMKTLTVRLNDFNTCNKVKHFLIFPAFANRWQMIVFPSDDVGGRNGKACVSCYIHHTGKDRVNAKCILSIIDSTGKPLLVNELPEHEFQSGNVLSDTSTLFTNGMEKVGWPAIFFVEDVNSENHYCDGGVLLLELKIIIFKQSMKRLIPDSYLEHSIEKKTAGLDLTSVLYDTQFSDAIIVTEDGSRLPVHKLILSIQSEIFRTMFLNGMKESILNEICIDDAQSETVKAMIEYLYTNKCNEEMLIAQPESLLHLSQKYQIKSLEKICENQLCCFIDSNNIRKWLEFADQRYLSSLKKACLSYIAKNAKLLVMDSGYDSLSSSSSSNNVFDNSSSTSNQSPKQFLDGITSSILEQEIIKALVGVHDDVAII